MVMMSDAGEHGFQVCRMNARERITGVAVQAQAIDRIQVLIDRLADQRVGKLVGARGVDVRLHDARLYCRLEAAQYALHFLIRCSGDFMSRELTSMDCRDT